MLLFLSPLPGGPPIAQIVFAQHTLRPAPEPGVGLLLATGLLGLALARRATNRR